MIQFSQRNGKLPLPRQKQGSYPVTTIYAERAYLRECIIFKVVNNLKPISSMQFFTKPNCNLCMEERLTILKNIHEKRVMLMNKNVDIYET